MRLSPLIYAYPLTGAVMPATTDLLADTSITPRIADRDISGALADPVGLWAERLSITPAEGQSAIEQALHGVMEATPALDPAGFTPDRLIRSRAKRHLQALCDL